MTDPWSDPDFVLDEMRDNGVRLPKADAPRVVRRGDPILLYGDRRTVLGFVDRGRGLLVIADDEAGHRIERYADRLLWDACERAWR